MTKAKALPLVLSSAFAKLAKAKSPKAEAKFAGYGRSMSMSTSMSVGPEPPITITLKGCGESFTDQKVVLSKDLDCGGPRDEGVDQQQCAVKLDGPLAELDCKDNTLSQVADSQEDYFDGPFFNGICLENGAKTKNCNVQQFVAGINVRNGAEVVNSVLRSNFRGIDAEFTEDATVTIEDT